MFSASLLLYRCSPAGVHLQVRAIWHRWLSDSIIWALPCPDQHWAHTGPDKRRPWQLVGHVFPQPQWTREFSGCKPAGGVRLCKWDKERHCGLEYLLWSWLLCKECYLDQFSKMVRVLDSDTLVYCWVELMPSKNIYWMNESGQLAFCYYAILQTHSNKKTDVKQKQLLKVNSIDFTLLAR